MITNYGTLEAEIADFLLRDDLTAVIPTFISFAHEKLNRDLRTRQMVQRATASLTTEYTALPGNFLQMRDIRLNANPVRSLEQISSEAQNQERERWGNTAGEPRYYTIIGETIVIWQTLFRDIFNSLTTEDEKSRFGGTTPRMRHRSFG